MECREVDVNYDRLRTRKSDNMALSRSKGSTHNNLMIVFSNTESVVVSVGLEVSNEIL